MIRSIALGGALLGVAITTTPAMAQSAARIDTIEAQIKALNAELAHVRRDMAAKDAAIRAAQADAAAARANTRQAQSAPPAAPFIPRSGQREELTLGLGAAHPTMLSPKADFTSLNSSGLSAGDQQAGNTGSKGTFHVGGITLQLGGFFEGTGVYRSRNEVTDIASNFNTGIPLRQSPQYHESELRGSARQSRFSLLAQGDITPTQRVSGYAELDLQGAAGTANSNESNSYNPRIRQVYGAYDNSDLGLHILAGQAWSLATMSKTGVTPRQENLPMTIDQQYLPGFSWARQTQLRVAHDFDSKYWLAASLEGPQTTYAVGSNGAGVTGATANFTNPGISSLTPGQAYSTNVAPDLIVKAAADPGYGHYEVFGIGRLFQDRVSTVGGGHNDNRLAGGIGGGVILPILGDKLSFEARALAGYGIGRYGSAQLPDATISRFGSPSPLPGVQAMVGLTGHPIPAVDLYGYVGTEQVAKKSFDAGGKAYGYGNSNYSNAGCDIELSTAACAGNTSGVVQGTVGGWWRFLHGNFGTVQAGAQYSYTQRSVFRGTTGVGGGGNKGTDENTVFVSLRYLPFQ